jgi:hypothetical protein
MATTDQKLVQAGQVQIEECILLSNGAGAIDFINQVDSVTIYEDIYSPFLTGYITITDTLDIPGYLGRSGRDMLKLKIFTPTVDKKSYIEGMFVVYKMSDRVEVRDRMQGYYLHFVSYEFTVDMMRCISRTFTGSPSALAKTILETQLGSTKNFRADTTSNTIKYTSNFWSPTQNLIYLANHAQNTSQASTYMFYENRDGFNFRTLEGISAEEVTQAFSMNDFTTDTNTDDKALRFGTAKRDPEKDYQSIRAIRIDTSYDFLRDYMDGMIKTKMYSHDLVTKRLDVRQVSLVTDTLAKMNKNKFYTDDVINKSDYLLMNMPRHYDVLDAGDGTDFGWKQKRLMQLGQYRAGIVEIDVYGRTDYTIGKKVSLDLNKMISISLIDDRSSYLDKLYSGNYVVTAIVHTFTRAEHKCTMELAKTHTNSE